MTSSKTLKLACAAAAALICVSAVAALRAPSSYVPVIVPVDEAPVVRIEDTSMVSTNTGTAAQVVVIGHRMSDQEKAQYDAQLGK